MLLRVRRRLWPVLACVAAFACSSGEGFKGEGAGGAGQSGAAGTTAGTKASGGSNAGGRAGSSNGGGQSQAGSAGAANGGVTAGSGGGGGKGGEGGSGGMLCPPCVPPPSPECVGSGPCGCGPYECPSGGASGDGIPCGPNTCSPPMVCCNPLQGTCTLPDQVCGA